MRFIQKREYRSVLLLVIAIGIAAFFIARARPELQIVYPEQDTILSQEDFSVNINGQVLELGSESRDRVIEVLPEGKMLGRSTIYQLDDPYCLLTFTRDEDILVKVHIESPEIPTQRGNKVGDPFSAVQQKYGEYFTWVSKSGQEEDFDAIYGSDNENSITFQVRQNKVSRIILQKELS